MFRAFRLAVPLAVVALVALPSCTAMRQLEALRSLTFAFSHVSDVRIVGIPLGQTTRFTSLGVADVARVAAAVASKQFPIEMVAHVSATNPSSNTVAANMVGLGWKLFVEDRETLEGQLDTGVLIQPGATADVPLTVRFDLLKMGSGGAQDLFDLAVAIAGQGSIQKDLSLELRPKVNTPLGPIHYRVPVVVHRGGPAS